MKGELGTMNGEEKGALYGQGESGGRQSFSSLNALLVKRYIVIQCHYPRWHSQEVWMN